MPEINLLYRASKGEISRRDDITHTVNYFNNGNHYLPEFLQNKINVISGYSIPSLTKKF